MNDRQANKLAMYSATLKVLRDNSALWTKITAFANAERELDSGIRSINEIGRRQSRDISGITLDKKALRDALADAVYETASALAAYAKKTRNNELRKETGLSRTEIGRLRDNLLSEFVKSVVTHCRANAKELETYNIDAAALDNLQKLSDAFAVKAPSTTVARNNRSADTRALKQLFGRTDALLADEIDKLMVRFKKPQPLFYDAFVAARTIIDLGKGSQYVDYIIKPNTTITIERFVNLSTFVNSGTVALEVFGDGLEGLWVAPGEQVQVQVNTPVIQVQNLHTEVTAQCRARVSSTIPVKKSSTVRSKLVTVLVKAGQSKRVEGIIPGTEAENLGPATVMLCDCADPDCGITDDDQPCGYEQTIESMSKGVLDTQQPFVNISNKDASKPARVKLRVYDKTK
jgi:hypothetical protein